jgi:hypothetical protein
MLESRNEFGDAAIDEQQVIWEEMFPYRGSASVGRADSARRPYSPFEGLMNECPRLCRGMVTPGYFMRAVLYVLVGNFALVTALLS